MLPTHLPMRALTDLIRDHISLTAGDGDECTPLELLTGYREGCEFGAMPYESEEDAETDPMARLRGGERLAIQLHSGPIDSECDFIDGETYAATDEEVTDNEDATDHFPDETGFFGVGVWLDGDRLALEPVVISGDMNGNVCVAKATFPQSMIDRTSAYLRRVAKETG